VTHDSSIPALHLTAGVTKGHFFQLRRSRIQVDVSAAQMFLQQFCLSLLPRAFTAVKIQDQWEAVPGKLLEPLIDANDFSQNDE
jgi:hypothetical protein